MATYLVSKNVVDLNIDPLVSCKLCLMECPLRDMYELKDCKCIYCTQCMKQYLHVMISEGSVTSLAYPDAHCPVSYNVKMYPIIIACHMPQCMKQYLHVMITEGSVMSLTCPDAHCPKHGKLLASECGSQFCSVCKSKWHGQQTCIDFLAKDGDSAGIPYENCVDAQIKRCPVCHVPIERNDGCAQMMCKRCKHVFCWYCLASLDDDFLLRHYDKGPCKNKLGHSRASVIWHRTQVVGIFAGFGVLLLVASPFLLLAAPCILCCKCKVCKCCDEVEDGDDIPPV